MKDIKTFDILVDGEKKGIAYDTNPIKLNNDDECREMLERMKEKINLNSVERDLIDRCLSVTTAKDDDIVFFGPEEMIKLFELSLNHAEYGLEIAAISHYLGQQIDYDEDIDDPDDKSDMYMKMINTFGSLTDLLFKGKELNDLDDPEM